MTVAHDIASDIRTLTTKDVQLRQNIFTRAERLRSVVIGEGLEVLGEHPDSYWDVLVKAVGIFEESGIRRVWLPMALRELHIATFKNCPKLQQIALPGGLEIIWDYCFYGSGLRATEIPRSVTRIGDKAFYSCKSLQSVAFQEGSRLSRIGCCAFQATIIERFVAPSSLKAIGQGAFCSCKRLRHVELNEGLETLGSDDYLCTGAFQDTALENIKLPSTLKKLGCWAFFGCGSITNVALPDGLEYLGRRCFSDTGTRKLTLPDSLTEIDEDAFDTEEDILVRISPTAKPSNTSTLDLEPSCSSTLLAKPRSETCASRSYGI